MEYQELISVLSDETKYTRREIRKILRLFAKHVRKALGDGRDVHIYGLGKLQNCPAKARVARDPRTNGAKPMIVPATRRVRFIPSDDLKAIVQASITLFKEENLELRFGLPRKEKRHGKVRSRDRSEEGTQGKEGGSGE
jgi:nucleoid DNA-binding protein